MRTDFAKLELEPLCAVSIQLERESPIQLGKNPWRNRRVSYIGGGIVEGERLKGVVRPGGGDWSEGGANAKGDALTLIDVRSLWRTHDGADIYVTYNGRLNIPAGVLAKFRDPETVDEVPVSDYYFRINPIFETADERYAWLNEVVAIGAGKRTRDGVIYTIFEVK